MITVQCDCGKRIGLSDALAGKTIKCPKCGNSHFVSAAPQAPAGKKTAAKKQNQAPTIYISKGKIVGLSVFAGVVLLIVIGYFGPLRVYNDWQKMEPKVNADVSDVITFGLQAYLSQQRLYDPIKQHHVPSVDSPITFLGPILSLSMPEKVPFLGKSNQGNFVGVYNTRTGDVVADVEYGGYTVAGLVDIGKATGKFHMTGRLANGFPQAEVDGASIKIVTPDTSSD